MDNKKLVVKVVLSNCVNLILKEIVMSLNERQFIKII